MTKYFFIQLEREGWVKADDNATEESVRRAVIDEFLNTDLRDSIVIHKWDHMAPFDYEGFNFDFDLTESGK